MDKGTDLAGIRDVIIDCDARDKQATALYLNNNVNISEATQALLELKDTTSAGYRKIILMQCDSIDLLQKACEDLHQKFNQMKHFYDVEKSKNTGNIKNN